MSLQQFLSYFPFPVLEIIPEVKHIVLPKEKGSTCSQCVRSCDTSQYIFEFHPDLRCCTFSPTLQNWQLGMILLDEDESSDLLIAELQKNKNHDAVSLRIQEQRQPLFDRMTLQNFGKDPHLRCAFLSQLQCGIWKNRNSTCRTWFCVHNDGIRSMKFWNDMRRFLLQLERETSSWCMKKHMPHLDSKDWYIQCAKSLQEASLKELSSIRSSTLMRLVNVLCTSYQEIMPPIPDIVRTEIADVYWEGEEVIFIGYSPFAPLRFHRDIFQFLSRLDGDTPWKEALNKSNQITTEQYTKKEVELLFRRGMLVASAGSHELLPQFSISFDGKQTLNSMMHEGFDVQIHIKAKED